MKRLRREVVRRDVLLSFDFWPPDSRLPSFLEGLSPLVVLSEESGVWLLTEVNPDIFNSSNSIEPANKNNKLTQLSTWSQEIFTRKKSNLNTRYWSIRPSSSLLSGPRAYAPYAPQPIGLLCDP